MSKNACCCSDENGNGSACCSETLEKAPAKSVLVEYLYLDLDTCDRCIGADEVLEAALDSVAPALKAAGYTVELKKTQIENEEMAQRYRFLASPTILVNGQDICGVVEENSCGCCGEISGTDVTCRTFTYQGQTFDVPSRQMLAEGILKCALSTPQPSCCGDDYAVPANLKNFFEGKAEKSGCPGGTACK